MLGYRFKSLKDSLVCPLCRHVLVLAFYKNWMSSGYRVYCASCDARGPEGKNEQEAVTLWLSSLSNSAD